ncbi:MULTISPECIES: peptidoglycan DD-metalloendopeptidase family protein [Burkholderia]|uniref:murein hydrolase activator EnvC family protein n=1 Tax=Burkholderia TaxID=32008 RepID=UPI000AA2D87B|nr:MULTISPECIES: peptidoglycan DD-metalloendopeptidase family protein [Burkholderia]
MDRAWYLFPASRAGHGTRATCPDPLQQRSEKSMPMMSYTKPTNLSDKSFTVTLALRAACAAAVAALAACATQPGSTPAAGAADAKGAVARQSQQSQQPRQSAASAAAPSFAWPVRGPILKNPDDAKHPGINIGGVAGEPVKAAADGVVAYAGDSLRGYGSFVIVKHDDVYLSAYAHNRKLMVKEGDKVAKGQTIAEMGDSDADRVMLHFEIRRKGVPVDPLTYLPAP